MFLVLGAIGAGGTLIGIASIPAATVDADLDDSTAEVSA
jgi:hypothetical protein